ncbi:hypothetical protein B0T22DRAFT_208136 [Podospora appendiculata]|uniref:Uncharacterized protein n=1 Tax=Podospora appendiculata TaxID=314037 RepID=A0AAE1CA13_9PEZI|nr:hypothetical protein B0T22DRAFT_208136 [Podospora appendiculata]
MVLCLVLLPKVPVCGCFEGKVHCHGPGRSQSSWSSEGHIMESLSRRSSGQNGHPKDGGRGNCRENHLSAPGFKSGQVRSACPTVPGSDGGRSKSQNDIDSTRTAPSTLKFMTVVIGWPTGNSGGSLQGPGAHQTDLANRYLHV